MTKRMMIVEAVVGLALVASAVETRLTVPAGETATIGTDIDNSSGGTCELVAEAGSTVVLPAAEGVPINEGRIPSRGPCWAILPASPH